MKRYAMAYVLWLVAVATMGAIMLEWYRRIEGIGWTEVADRLRGIVRDEAERTANYGAHENRNGS